MQRLVFTFWVLFTVTLLSPIALANNRTNGADVNQSINTLQHEWARIKYKTPNKKEQLNQMSRLASKAAQAAKVSPNSAEIKIWQAIIISTQAGLKGGFGALRLVKRSKKLLLDAIKINPNALNGSAYTSLGTLYYQVPGWPLGFGNNATAKKYLTKALEINPRGIDPNFFYGDFLFKQGQYQQAITVLNTALAASARRTRPLADAGRRQEIMQLLKKARAAVNS